LDFLQRLHSCKPVEQSGPECDLLLTRTKPCGLNPTLLRIRRGKAAGSVADLVYKIVDEQEWRQAQRSGSYQGSDDDRRDGFIHLSFAGQVADTAARHFRNRSGLLLIAFSSEALGDALQFEPSRGGALFPHLYADLPTSAAHSEQPMTLDADGVPQATGAAL
jgi:uncharacterized protein (DUF952 family)